MFSQPSEPTSDNRGRTHRRHRRCMRHEEGRCATSQDRQCVFSDEPVDGSCCLLALSLRPRWSRSGVQVLAVRLLRTTPAPLGNRRRSRNPTCPEISRWRQTASGLTSRCRSSRTPPTSTRTYGVKVPLMRCKASVRVPDRDEVRYEAGARRGMPGRLLSRRSADGAGSGSSHRWPSRSAQSHRRASWAA
jgi:hypothetical protein